MASLPTKNISSSRASLSNSKQFGMFLQRKLKRVIPSSLLFLLSWIEEGMGLCLRPLNLIRWTVAGGYLAALFSS